MKKLESATLAACDSVWARFGVSGSLHSVAAGIIQTRRLMGAVTVGISWERVSWGAAPSWHGPGWALP